MDKNKFITILIKLGKVDRRVIFLLIAIVVLIPLLKPLGLPIRATETTQRSFNAVDSLQAGDRLLMSFEYGPSTKPEIHPMAEAVLHHAFLKGIKVYVVCLWPDGQFMAIDALNAIAPLYDTVYGEDYVLLGFRPGNEAVVKGIASNLRKLYTVDYQNTLVDSIPMMAGVYSLKDFNLIFSFSAGYPGTVEWVQYGSDPTGVPMTTGTASIQVNEIIPYENAGQLRGVIAGMPGAAEYEALVGKPGLGISGMDAQSIAHLVIVLFIIFGNITYFLERKRSQKKY
ncbi:MAG: hypothetical protein K9N34_00490 [Candidatus Marinimicrobia bacterium]|nr:hypothetical protein [Candidatus Neomarinimicrobiota bacterium]MCF7840010.1 hypothetical protein [Candidatus Neomarinimicrobiota bacterium]